MKTYQFCPWCASPLEMRHTDDRDRLACTSSECTFIHYDNPTPVVAAIVTRGEEVVLVRSVGWPESWFGLVTGFLERGESPEEGVLREVEEELSIKGELVEFVGVYDFVQMNQLIVAYQVRVPHDAEIVICEELSAYKLVPIARLRPWPMGTGEAVAHWLERQR